MKAKDYKYIYLPSGDYLQIKFDEKGIVYDRFNEDDEHQENYGYDFYNDINLKPTIMKAKDCADDSATYWKDNFENLYNDIAKALITDGEEMTDGECVDAIFYALEKYEGESDELTEVNFDGLN